ncbi:MAG TPA: trypsin-like peptidase domain-containing protein [Polyangiaceae bacterium]|nr:trypsin-like peptidase domain-containing protein [Polyangiaceae bacterium]
MITGSRAAVWLAVVALVATGCKAPHGGGSGGGGGDGSVELPPGATPVASTLAPQPTTALPPAVVSPVGTLQPAPLTFAPIAKAADPSVVTINTVATEVEVSPFTHRRRQALAKGLGTGFVVDAKNGIILTNNHVIDNAQEIEVQLSDQRRLPGKVVGTDSRTDIAAIRIDAKGLRSLPLGDSDAIDVGDWVVAIGNPFGLSHTVSAGIISAKGRTRDDVPLDPSGMYDFLQTDASINPGNSGGPLLNLKGEVVGMNSAIRGGGAQGIGFAIPMNMIKQLLPMLLRDGHVTRSALGVNIKDVHELGPEEREAVGLAEGQEMNGAVIFGVSHGGPADRAGLEQGDIIVAFDGTAIDRSAQLQWLASTAGVGRTVTLRVQRSGKVFDQRVILGQLQDQVAPPR